MSAKVIRISGALVDGHVTAKSELAFQVAALLVDSRSESFDRARTPIDQATCR